MAHTVRQEWPKLFTHYGQGLAAWFMMDYFSPAFCLKKDNFKQEKFKDLKFRCIQPRVFVSYESIIGKTVSSVSALFKELAQHPPHKRFEVWN